MLQTETKSITRRRQITQTSLAIIDTIYRYRYITTEGLHRILGGERRNLCFHLQALSEYHKLISRLPLFDQATGNFQCYVYFLASTRPLELLCERGIRKPNELDFDRYSHGGSEASEGRHLFIRHELMISRFHAMLELACRQSGGEVELADFKQGAYLHSKVYTPALTTKTQVIARQPQQVLFESSERETVPVRPDAFATLHFPNRGEGKYSHFFYEADRRTMDTTKMKKKLRGYFHFIVKQKLHQLRYKIENVRAVLIETISDQWAEVLRQAASDPVVSGPKPSNLFWFTPSNFFTQPITKQIGDKLKTIPYYLEHPEVIFGNYWFTPNDRAGDSARSLLDL